MTDINIDPKFLLEENARLEKENNSLRDTIRLYNSLGLTLSMMEVDANRLKQNGDPKYKEMEKIADVTRAMIMIMAHQHASEELRLPNGTFMNTIQIRTYIRQTAKSKVGGRE